MMQRRTNSEILPKKSVKKEFRPRREVAMAMLNKAPGETGETTKFGLGMNGQLLKVSTLRSKKTFQKFEEKFPGWW